MRSLITQSVVLPAPAEHLYSIYLDPALGPQADRPVVRTGLSGSQCPLAEILLGALEALFRSRMTHAFGSPSLPAVLAFAYAMRFSRRRLR